MIHRVPIIAGDSLGFSIAGTLRMNALRRPLPFDIRCDLYGFYVPYRYTYGDSFLEFLRTAGESTNPFQQTANQKTWTTDQPWVMQWPGTVPIHTVSDTCEIWNHFFRDTQQGELVPTIEPDESHRQWGPLCGNIASWETSTTNEQEGTIGNVNAVTSGNNTVFHITQTFTAAREYRRAQLQHALGERTEDIHRRIWGRLPTLADERPQYLKHSERWLSSHDIVGTAGITFAETSARLVTGARLRIPRSYFAEHGQVYFFMLLRPRVQWKKSRQFLDRTNNMTYDQMAGDPQAAVQAPLQVHTQDFWSDGNGSDAMGYVPWYNWYRTASGYVSPLLDEEDTAWQGRPTPSGGRLGSISVPSYNDVFHTTQAGQFKFFSTCGTMGWRHLGSPMESIMGGGGL